MKIESETFGGLSKVFKQDNKHTVHLPTLEFNRELLSYLVQATLLRVCAGFK